MTGRQTGESAGAVLEALLAANVQFVVVGEPAGRPTLRVVVSRHPTNLGALGALLARVEASLRADGAPGRGEATTPAALDSAAGAGGGMRRIGDAFATVPVRALGADVDVMFGGPHRSLYAETLAVAVDRQMFGRLVKWAPAAPDAVPPPRGTGPSLGRRLLSIAEGIAHFAEREPEPRGDAPSHGEVPPTGEGAPDGERPEN